MISSRLTTGLCGLFILLSVVAPRAQGAFQLNASATGNTVVLSWPAVPGASIYGVQAQVQGGPTLPLTPVGNVTAVQIPNVPAGSYLIRVTASNGLQSVQSNIASVAVAIPGSPTPAPTNFAASAAGNDVTFSWTLATSAGLTGLMVERLSGPAGAVIQQIPVRVSTSAYVPSVPNGIYTLRIRGVGSSGFSAASNEVNLALPTCSPIAPIQLNSSTSSGFVGLSWPAVPGATSYQLNVSSVPGGSPNVLSQTLPATTTSLSRSGLPSGNYYVTLLASVGCATASSGERLVTVTNPPGEGPRGPVITNPCPNAQTACDPSRYPNLGQAQQIIASVAARYPGDLRNSCGNNIWLFRVVQALRQVDSRWGLMWKRRVVGDLSQDVIAYQFSAAPDEGSDQMYAWDIIAGHCGSNPSWWFNNISSLNPSGAIWTLRPYTAAGFPR
ncbi:MAG: hypothetical protein ABR606_18665 [Vicinamibacterales bacterium]